MKLLINITGLAGSLYATYIGLIHDQMWLILFGVPLAIGNALGLVLYQDHGRAS